MGDISVGALPNVASPATTDSLAGEFSGSTGKATIASVLALATEGSSTFEGLSDVDHTTETTGYVLSKTPSNGKPFSFVAATSGGGGSGATTLESLTDVDHNTEHNGYALVAVVGAGQYDSAVLATTGLTNYYPFSDAPGSTAVDQVGGLTGAVIGSPNPLGAASISGDGETCYFGAVAGNGGSQSISSGAALSPAAWSLEFVAKISSADATAHFPTIYTTNLGFNGLWIIAQNTSTNAATIDINTPGGNINSVYQYTGSDVVHVMVTYDGTHLKLYINGALDSQITPTQQPSPTSSTSYFGSYQENGDFYEGYLAKFAFYDVALPASEAQSHYAALTGTQPNTFKFVPVGPTLVESYSFSGSSTMSTNTWTPTIGTKYTVLAEFLVNGDSFLNLTLQDNATPTNAFAVQWHISAGNGYLYNITASNTNVGTVVTCPTSFSENGLHTLTMELLVGAGGLITYRGFIDGCFVGSGQATISGLAGTALYAAIAGGNVANPFNVYKGWLITQPSLSLT